MERTARVHTVFHVKHCFTNIIIVQFALYFSLSFFHILSRYFFSHAACFPRPKVKQQCILHSTIPFIDMKMLFVTYKISFRLQQTSAKKGTTSEIKFNLTKSRNESYIFCKNMMIMITVGFPLSSSCAVHLCMWTATSS